MTPTQERDRARNERDRARDTLAKIRGVIVAHAKGVLDDDRALAKIASMLHVGDVNRRRGVSPARREQRATP